MNEQNLYKLTKMRNERNNRLDLIAEKLSHCIIKGQPATFSFLYTIQNSEAEELIENFYNSHLVSDDLLDLIDIHEKERIQTAIADSIFLSPEHPIGDEEMAFLITTHGDKKVRSIKIRNLFAKSEFNTLDFLKSLSAFISELAVLFINLPQNNKIETIVKLSCFVIFNAASLIQNITIEFNEKHSAILSYLIKDENGITGVEKTNVVEYLQNLFNGIDENEINNHINELKEIGCIEIDESNLISLKERIINYRRKK